MENDSQIVYTIFISTLYLSIEDTLFLFRIDQVRAYKEKSLKIIIRKFVYYRRSNFQNFDASDLISRRFESDRVLLL